MLTKIIAHCAIFGIVFQIAISDTPADCRFDDIVGAWIFYEGPRGNTKDIDCTNPTGLSSQTEVTLSYPNLVQDKNGNQGTWTLIYNEGFEVTLNGRKWFAFSNWTTDDRGKVTSHCDLTDFGWSHKLDVTDWSCYYGKKKDSGVARTREFKKPDFLSLSSKKYRTNYKMIDQINTAQKMWKARPYPEHEKYTLLEMRRRMGGLKSRPEPPKPALITPEIQKLVNDLPDSWDWRNVNGVNYVSPVRDQGSCGSCYAFASTGELEARYRIVTNNTQQPVFSVQDIIECSEYAQGCDGGWTYLIAGKYADDFGMVAEECNPYRPFLANACHTNKTCTRYYATSDYEYVGGYYGACNEALMRLALVNNGPVTVDFMVYNDFSGYAGGIYKHTGFKDDLNDFDPLQLVNHGVLAVGYGTDKDTNTPYWIVKNSWGAAWGENGYFRIVRGTNECAIESAAVQSTPLPGKF